MKISIFSAMLLSALATGNVGASVILSPVGIVSNELGELFPVERLFNQSGLQANTFISGLTDFDDYIAGSPTTANNNVSQIFASAIGVTTGAIVFDLGTLQTIEKIVVFQSGTSQERVNEFAVATSGNASGQFVDVGTFNALQGPFFGDQQAQVFDLIDTESQFVRLTVNSNFGSPDITVIGEVAFEVSPIAVPEPSSVLVSMLLAAGFAQRRHRSVLP